MGSQNRADLERVATFYGHVGKIYSELSAGRIPQRESDEAFNCLWGYNWRVDECTLEGMRSAWKGLEQEMADRK